jgi:hypothetical protein
MATFYAQAGWSQCCAAAPFGECKVREIPVKSKNNIATLTAWNMWTGESDSCAGVTPYCSVLFVGYDISCGSFDPLSSGVLRKRSGALFAPGEG